MAKYRDLEWASLKQDDTKALCKCQVKKKSKYLRADKHNHQFTHQLLDKVIQLSFATTIHELKTGTYCSLSFFCHCVFVKAGVHVHSGPLGLKQLHCSKGPC